MLKVQRAHQEDGRNGNAKDIRVSATSNLTPELLVARASCPVLVRAVMIMRYKQANLMHAATSKQKIIICIQYTYIGNRPSAQCLCRSMIKHKLPSQQALRCVAWDDRRDRG